MKSIFIITIILNLVVSFACGPERKDYRTEPAPAPVTPTLPVTSASTNKGSITELQIRQLIDNNRCSVCHSFMKEPDYLKNPEHIASIVASVESNKMPVGGPLVAEADRKLLRNWKIQLDVCANTPASPGC